MHLKTTEGIYSSKEAKYLAAMKHGTTGWKESEEKVWQRFIFFQPKGTNEGIWLPAEDYISQIDSLRRRNRDFYRTHPNLLKSKIREKRKPQIFAHSLYR